MSTVTLFLALAIVLVHHQVAEADDLPGCPSYLKRDKFLKTHKDKCYEFLVHRQLTWQQAEEDCKTREGHLVTVRNLEEQSFLMNSLRSYNFDGEGVWIGLNDRQLERTFTWISGETSGFTFWANGEPDHSTRRRRFLLDFLGPDEDCVLLIYTEGGHWHDRPCEKLDIIGLLPENYPYVCEYKKEILTTPTTSPTTTVRADTPSRTTATGTSTIQNMSSRRIGSSAASWISIIQNFSSRRVVTSTTTGTSTVQNMSSRRVVTATATGTSTIQNLSSRHVTTTGKGRN